MGWPVVWGAGHKLHFYGSRCISMIIIILFVFTILKNFSLNIIIINCIGRGCGGKLFNIEGTVTSPLYPYVYRKNTSCRWDIAVPRPYPISIAFRSGYNII